MADAQLHNAAERTDDVLGEDLFGDEDPTNPSGVGGENPEVNPGDGEEHSEKEPGPKDKSPVPSGQGSQVEDESDKDSEIDPVSLALLRYGNHYNTVRATHPHWDRDTSRSLALHKLKEQDVVSYKIYKKHEAEVAAKREEKKKKAEARRLEEEQGTGSGEKNDPIPPGPTVVNPGSASKGAKKSSRVTPQKRKRSDVPSKPRKKRAVDEDGLPILEPGTLRDPVCIGCLRSILHGSSWGECIEMENPVENDDGELEHFACKRCDKGKTACIRIPPDMVKISRKFIDLVRCVNGVPKKSDVAYVSKSVRLWLDDFDKERKNQKEELKKFGVVKTKLPAAGPRDPSILPFGVGDPPVPASSGSFTQGGSPHKSRKTASGSGSTSETKKA
ncbi:hypothetical protein LZ32DRAFT_664567, partial [Colletotrichum eremochloae]